ncbi:MAG: DUF4301 family protein [Smithella sp.]
MKKNIFSPKDLIQIKNLDISPADVEKQLDLNRQGTKYLKLNRPCTVDDGVVSFSPKQRKKLVNLFDGECGLYKIIKFVPASGAASRMFADWFSALGRGGFGSKESDRKFLRDLKKLPFFHLVAENKTAADFLKKKDITGLLKFILADAGLNFGNLPKALIPFHRYVEGELRTAMEEHFVEAAGHVTGADGINHLHFTISTEHEPYIAACIKEIINKYKVFIPITYSVTLSFQSASTNTIAVDEKNQPLRNAEGELIFRPGGHGALLTNLNLLDADLIFVKNIDNIVPSLRSEKHLPFRKMLGGMALKIQKETFEFLRELEGGQTDNLQIEKIVAYCSQTLNVVFPQSFAGQTKKKKIQTLFSLLNRPLRVCGVVKNDGEPGGGPFWVAEKNGTQSLQIVESSHVDKNNPEQAAIWSQAQYFNPVDMVCCIKNYRGEKFILDNYVDKNAYLISMKNEKGIKFKALELPGLWNGSMAYWNTIFVEMPLKVFNPVKTVYDLLRPVHRKTS